jgi:hypothetical protein
MIKYNIKQLINKDLLDKSIAINEDGYGSACVLVAINVMEFLDTFEGEFNIGYHPDLSTPHGIISHCDDQGGITGFMAGAARNIVAACHEKGWKFYLADVINSYNLEESKENYIHNILKLEGVNVKEEEIRQYITDLIERYKNSQVKNKAC